MKQADPALVSLIEALPFPAFRQLEDRVEALNEAARQLRDWLAASGLEVPGPGHPMFKRAFRLAEESGQILIPGLANAERTLSACRESFGRNMGGIVHNLNNPLNALSGMVQLMMFRMPDKPELEQLDNQIDVLARLIRELGDRFRRMEELEPGMPMTWELVIDEELRFYRAMPALKHRTLLDTVIPADASCPLDFRDSCLLLDLMLDSVLACVPDEGQAPLKVDLCDGWPRFRLEGPREDRQIESVELLQPHRLINMLAAHGRRPEWRIESGTLTVACVPAT